MGLGTKNRQKQTADICKPHLREKYRDKLALVEDVDYLPSCSESLTLRPSPSVLASYCSNCACKPLKGAFVKFEESFLAVSEGLAFVEVMVVVVNSLSIVSNMLSVVKLNT